MLGLVSRFIKRSNLTKTNNWGGIHMWCLIQYMLIWLNNCVLSHVNFSHCGVSCGYSCTCPASVMCNLKKKKIKSRPHVFPHQGGCLIFTSLSQCSLPYDILDDKAPIFRQLYCIVSLSALCYCFPCCPQFDLFNSSPELCWRLK